MDESNDAPPAPPAGPHECRIRFGTQPSSTIPADWAELMLTDLAAKNRAIFGRLLLKAATGSGGTDGV